MKLGEIQPEGWPAEYTTEFMNVLNVLGRLVEIEASQAELLERICSAETISDDELREAGAFYADASGGESAGQAKLLDE